MPLFQQVLVVGLHPYHQGHCAVVQLPEKTIGPSVESQCVNLETCGWNVVVPVIQVQGLWEKHPNATRLGVKVLHFDGTTSELTLLKGQDRMAIYNHPIRLARQEGIFTGSVTLTMTVESDPVEGEQPEHHAKYTAVYQFQASQAKGNSLVERLRDVALNSPLAQPIQAGNRLWIPLIGDLLIRDQQPAQEFQEVELNARQDCSSPRSNELARTSNPAETQSLTDLRRENAALESELEQLNAQRAKVIAQELARREDLRRRIRAVRADLGSSHVTTSLCSSSLGPSAPFRPGTDSLSSSVPLSVSVSRQPTADATRPAPGRQASLDPRQRPEAATKRPNETAPSAQSDANSSKRMKTSNNSNSSATSGPSAPVNAQSGGGLPEKT